MDNDCFDELSAALSVSDDWFDDDLGMSDDFFDVDEVDDGFICEIWCSRFGVNFNLFNVNCSSFLVLFLLVLFFHCTIMSLILFFKDHGCWLGLVRIFVRTISFEDIDRWIIGGGIIGVVVVVGGGGGIIGGVVVVVVGGGIIGGGFVGVGVFVFVGVGVFVFVGGGGFVGVGVFVFGDVFLTK